MALLRREREVRIMSPSIFIRRHKLGVASFIAASALVTCWEAGPADASMTMTPQSIRSADTPSHMITPVCAQRHCYTYEQYMTPGFDRNKVRPAGGPGKVDPAKLRADRDCIARGNRSSDCSRESGLRD